MIRQDLMCCGPCGFNLSFLLLLSVIMVLANASYIDISNAAAVLAKDDGAAYPTTTSSDANGQNEQLCTLCQEFTAQIVDCLEQNKTQEEIIDALHQACSQLHSFQQQCMILVDYYTPIFFIEIEKISPDKFCEKLNLCENMKFVSAFRSNSVCTVCHQAVVEILLKLKDPEFQMEVIGSILKACDKIDHLSQKCVNLVMEYAPAILVNAENFLETTDVCSSIKACKFIEKTSTKPTFVTETALYDS